VGQAGGSLLQPPGHERAVAPDDPALLEAMVVTRGLLTEGSTPRSMTTESGQRTDSLLTAQQVATAHVGSSTRRGSRGRSAWTPTPLSVREQETADLASCCRGPSR